jgi:hypothetical protein
MWLMPAFPEIDRDDDDGRQRGARRVTSREPGPGERHTRVETVKKAAY